MTSRQSFALYCKTGYDVRGCTLSNDDISTLFSIPYQIARKVLSEIPGAIKKGIPKHKNGYMSKEHQLLHDYAMKRAEKAYHNCIITHTTVEGKRVYVKMSAIRSYGKYMRQAYPGKKGAYMLVEFGNSINGNISAASEYCCFLYELGIKDVDYEVI